MSESVKVDVHLNSTIDQVWQALTTSETLSKWMMFKSNTFKPELGHEFQFSGAQGYDQTIECRVMEIEEPNRLAYSWSAPGVDGELSETQVKFTLSEADGGTNLSLVQSGFKPEATQELGGAKAGWSYMLAELANVLTTSRST